MAKNNDHTHFIDHNKLLKLVKNHKNYITLMNNYVCQINHPKPNKSHTKKQKRKQK